MLEPSLPTGMSPLIAAIVDELNAEYPLTTTQAVPAGMPASLPSQMGSPLVTIGEQLA